MKQYYALILLAGILSGCSQHPDKHEFQIDGSFAKPFTGTVYLGKVMDKFTYVDSVSIHAEKEFTFTHPIESTDSYRLVTKPFSGSCSIVAEAGGKYHIEFAEGETTHVDAENAPEQVLMNAFASKRQAHRKESEKLSYRYAQAEEKKDEESLKRISDKLQVLFNAEEQMKLDFILENPATFAAVDVADQLFTNDFPTLERVYHTIDTLSFKQTYAFRSFKKKLKDRESLWIEGTQAFDFTTHDIHGKEVKLSDFRGKYVLLDFWASWCQSCRLKAKDMMKVYPELQKRGIHVLGVSLDENRKNWIKASEDDQIIWTNTCEVKPFKGHQIAQYYKVKQIPSFFLIDPNGKIVKQDPDLEDLLKLPIN